MITFTIMVSIIIVAVAVATVLLTRSVDIAFNVKVR